MGKPCPNRPSDDDLRSLYVAQRLTAAKIADQVGVSKKTVLDWLRQAEVPRRAVSHGLANRGGQMPTRDDVLTMMRVEHMSFAAIGERYGVDKTAVSYWAKKYGLTAPTVWETRRPGGLPLVPPAAELRERAARGESIAAIARSCGGSSSRVADAFRTHGIPINHDGWGQALICADGHPARSLYEQRVDDWLTDAGLEHQIEPSYPWDARFKADFKVRDTYIEVWGVTHSARYDARKARKIRECKAAGLPLLQIQAHHFNKRRLWLRTLSRLLEVEGASDCRLDFSS